MDLLNIGLRCMNRYRSIRSSFSNKQSYQMKNPRPIISFTFDDVPKSSCELGGEILKAHGLRGTYFISMSLMGKSYSIGEAFSRSDLDNLIADGHEIGCHTYGHLDAWKTDPGSLKKSIWENQEKFNEIYPGRSFNTFAYPINAPHPRNKNIAGKHFVCCRGGGQDYNSGMIDLNLLKAYFVDKRNRDDRDGILLTVRKNLDNNGWLIIGTHDIDESPSPYGCTPKLFEDLVLFSLRSGARIVPVNDACSLIGL